jgi:YbbR domain-containing protein
MTARTSRWVYRFGALLIAVALWYVIAAEKRELESEKIVEASVTYNTPRRVVLLNRVGQVRILVQGSRKEIRRLRPFDLDVLVDLSEEKPGRVNVDLTPDDVALPNDNLTVLSIEPKQLTLELDDEMEKRVPVEIDLGGEPAAGAIITARTVTPSAALVAGPASRIANLQRLLTGKVLLDGHAFSFEQQVALLAPDPLIRILQPTSVLVQINLEQPPAGGRQTLP